MRLDVARFTIRTASATVRSWNPPTHWITLSWPRPPVAARARSRKSPSQQMRWPARKFPASAPSATISPANITPGRTPCIQWRLTSIQEDHIVSDTQKASLSPEVVLAEMKKNEILPLVRMWHLNDSKTAMGSRVDRHEHIGEGQIDLSCFRRILNHKGFSTLPMVLETPKDGDDEFAMDLRNLATLRKLIA